MDNRERILEAAGQVYAQHGFRGATTRRIAQAAGVNEVTLFRLFGSKAQLFAQLRNSALSAHGVPALPDTPEHPVEELTRWCDGMLRRMTAQRSTLRKLMSELEEHPDVAIAACESASCAGGILEHYVAQLRELGFTDPAADDRTSMSMLISALFGDAMTREMIPHTKPQPFDDAPALYVRAFLRSLGAQVAADGTLKRQPSRTRVGSRRSA